MFTVLVYACPALLLLNADQIANQFQFFVLTNFKDFFSDFVNYANSGDLQ
jgi:hypothetical protein